VADQNTVLPGTAIPISTFSEPSIGAFSVGFRASGLGAGARLLTYDQAVQTLVDQGPALGTRQLVSATDAGDVYSWYESGPSFSGEIYTLGGGIPVPVSFVSGGVGLSDGSDTADIILANRFNRVIPFSFRAGGGTFGLCVGYEATLASDPTNQLHLLETCETAPGEFETTLLLSPGEVIDGATLSSWVMRQEAATPGALFIVANFADGGRGVILIEDEPASIDTDGDGVADDADNCLAPNPNQRDTDGDSIGNACDGDLNNDCIVNVQDLGLLRSVFFSADAEADFNGDGVVNVIDLGLLRTFFFNAPGPSGLPNACSGS
ncbi:MAG: dockerin type I repeat-containing protein, partial [Pseudomonadota bacterium]